MKVSRFNLSNVYYEKKKADDPVKDLSRPHNSVSSINSILEVFCVVTMAFTGWDGRRTCRTQFLDQKAYALFLHFRHLYEPLRPYVKDNGALRKPNVS